MMTVFHEDGKATLYVDDFLMADDVLVYDVISLEADGDELAMILLYFRNLPQTISRVQSWSEPWASYILRNLPLIARNGETAETQTVGQTTTT